METSAASFANLFTQSKASLPSDPAQIKKVAEDFESVFLSQMLQSMFPEENQESEAFGGGEGEDINRGMMVEQYGKLIASHGGIGIADYIQRQLLQHQEIAS